MYVEIDGARLEVERWTAGKGSPPIVLLHEGLGSVSAWKDFPQTLAVATASTVIAYSRAGYGNSSALSGPRGVDYMHYEAETVLPALLERLGVERPILFGHSDGASIALIFAGHYPERVSALVLEAPHVFVEDVTIASIAQITQTYASDTRLRESLARHHANAEATFRGWSDIWLDPAFRSWNIETVLGAAVPTIVIQGLDDEYGTFEQVDAIAARVPSAEILSLEDCKHAPHRDAQDAVLARVAAFIDNVYA